MLESVKHEEENGEFKETGELYRQTVIIIEIC